MEAMNYSLPVVATDCGDIKYLVSEGVNGFICQTGNPDEIGDRLNRLFIDADLVSSMSSNSNRIIREGFAPEIMLEKYLHLIEGLPA
jgi:glycosyltransferase involved in cell wall biosynthesis